MFNEKIMFFASVLISFSLLQIEPLLAQGAAPAQPQANGSEEIQTVDYLVPHISTVPANSGKRVELFVREKVRKRRQGDRRVVLVIHGATVSVVPGFDLQFENYSWMD